jgi:hypothetical protein
LVVFSWVVFLLFLLSRADAADQTRFSSSTNTMVFQIFSRVPDEFPHFTFVNHAEQAQLLSHYLWYHFRHRLGNSPTLFNKEYLLTSDIWLGNAYPRDSKERIQDVHRRNLLAVHMDDEGYVSSHQHFSQAHDLGWPLPSWAQAGNNPEHMKGKTVGWHFQPVLSENPSMHLFKPPRGNQ